MPFVLAPFLFALTLPVVPPAAAETPAAAGDCPALLDHRFRTLAADRSDHLCETWRGQVLLVVNTASKCGYTPQFDGLEKLQQTYGARGFSVLGFPSNDFRQELAAEGEILQFCRLTYGVEFPMYEPTAVAAGDAQHPFYRALSAAAGQAPRWNFQKYLIDRSGRLVASFPAQTDPQDPTLITAIEKLL